jgi:hypothetical protein
MYTKKKGRKNRNKSSRKNKKTKKRVKNGGTPPRVWTQLPREHQSLCVKKYPENLRELGNECYKYADKLWVRSNYDMNDVTDELAPLHIFNETNPNNYRDIQEGIHNFMLFWDDAAQQYTLVTSYFNAFEVGSKHNILSLRSIDKTPDTFIISGEIKKRGHSIHFHDTSSQYFRQECNLKRRAPVIYLYNLIAENSIEIDEDGDVADFDLDFLKRTILKNNTFNPSFNFELAAVQTLPDLKTLLLNYFPIGKIEESAIALDYTYLIQNILTDAFQRIFQLDIKVGYVPVFKEEEYAEHGQKDVQEMTEKLCPDLPFDVYSTQAACKDKEVKKKLPYSSCIIPKNESSLPTAKRQRKK